jgi:hypothetical protein
MPQVISFEGYEPPERFDAIPWTQVRVDEGTAVTGPWVPLETINLSPTDPDPANPLVRSFTTALATDLPDLWYRATFLDGGGDTSQPTVPVQNSTPVYYADVDELALILRVNADQRRAALERVLAAAAAEIDAELGLDEPYVSAPALVVEVNLERAVEHWQQQQSPFAVLGLGGDFGAITVARDTWDRHAHKLAPLKESWGLA